MKISRRSGLLILIGLALVTVLLLAGSLQNTTFSPGYSLPFGQMLPDFKPPTGDAASPQPLLNVMRILFILGWILLPFFVIYLIISPEARKRFLRDMLATIPFLLILYFVMRSPPQGEMIKQVDERMQAQQLEEGPLPPQQELTFEANPSEWVVTATTVVLAISATGLLLGIGFLYYRSRRPKLQPLQRLAFEAQAAIDAIEAGGDLRDVILRCYYEMNRAIGDTRNLKRSSDMTAQEFATFLLEHGLPSEPIYNLTNLFEKVRYGAFQPGRMEERLAVSSLSAIVAACQRVVRE